MENIAAMPGLQGGIKAENWFGFDTKLVTFFLAMDAGRTLGTLDLNEFLSFLTIGIFVVLSYFLPVPSEKRAFTGWIAVGLTVAVIGVALGSRLNVLSQIMLMEYLRFLPMIFLILTGILCAATQIRGIIGVRLAG